MTPDKAYTGLEIDTRIDLPADEITMQYKNEYAMTLIQDDAYPESLVKVGINGVDVINQKVFACSSTADITDSEITSKLYNKGETYRLQTIWFKRLYVYRKLKNEDGTDHIPMDEVGEPISVTDSFGNAFAYKGSFRLTDIIEDMFHRCKINLKVVYRLSRRDYNYPVVDKYNVSKLVDGTPASIIEELLRPLQIEMLYKIEAVVVDDSLIIRKRTLEVDQNTMTLDINDLHASKITVKRELYRQPFRHAVIEYYEPAAPNLEPVTTSTTELTLSPIDNRILVRKINTVTKIQDVTIGETSTMWRDSTRTPFELVLVNETTTTYTYDNPPDQLDIDGLFTKYRNLLKKEITSVEYATVIPPTGPITPSHIQTVKTTIDSIYNDKKELISESELIATDIYSGTSIISSTSRRNMTEYKQLKPDEIEIRKTSLVNDKVTAITVNMQSGKLRKAERAPFNANRNPNRVKKFLHKFGNLSNGPERIYGRVLKVTSEYLRFVELYQVYLHMRLESVHIKVTLIIDCIPMGWINRMTDIQLTGSKTVHMITYDAAGNADERDVVIDFSTFTNTPYYVLDQSVVVDEKSMTGRLTLEGYLLLGGSKTDGFGGT